MTLRWSYLLALVVCVHTVMPSAATAQGIPFAVGGDNVEAESSMIPFKVKFRGILNGPAKGKVLAKVALNISTYKATYDFDVLTAEALDNPQISGRAILQQYKDGRKELNLAGPKELLSKIGQAEPGTPLALAGFLRQRQRTLQLTGVETLGGEP
jgi:hypothetical protein